MDKAIKLFESIISKTDEILPDCSTALQQELRHQREGLVIAVDILTEAVSEKPKEPTTADNLLWLVENVAEFKVCHMNFWNVGILDIRLLGAGYKREYQFGQKRDLENLEQAIHAAYDWAQAEKAKESKE